MPRLVAEFPAFRPRWDEHLEYWEGKPAGYYNDITQFVYFVVRDLYPSGKIEEVQRALDVMEDLLKNGSSAVRELVVIGFLEDFKISHQGNFAEAGLLAAPVLPNLLVARPVRPSGNRGDWVWAHVPWSFGAARLAGRIVPFQAEVRLSGLR